MAIRYQCDKCGAGLGANDSHRYIVRMEVYAAAGPVDISSGMDTKSRLDAVLKELAEADPDEVEDQTYVLLRFDLCDGCRRKLLARPLG